MKKYLLVLMMTLSVSWMASAQVQFSFTSDTLSMPGGTVDIDVRISGFEDVAGVQLSFNWDASAFSFQEILNVTDDLDGFAIESIGTPDNAVVVQDGQLTMQWISPDTGPRSLPDGTRLFTLRLQGSGPQCSSTTLTISDNPRRIEVLDSELNDISATAVGGNIGIIDATCTGGGGGGMEDGLAFSFGNVSGSQGSTICIPLTANDFEDVFSFQSQFTWDPNVLRFTEVRDAGLTRVNLNDQMADNGSINVIWLFDQASVTLPDGATLFELCFEVVGSAGQSTSLSLNNDPNFPIEISTGSGSIDNFSITPLNFTVGSGGGGGSEIGVGLIAEDVVTGGATNICVPITTRDFDAIGAFQAGITFDPAVLRFSGINQAGLDGVDVGDGDASSGMLRILWQADFSTPSVTLPDDTVLFELCFDVIGADGTSSNIAFANFPPFNIEFSSEIGQSVDFFTQDGVVTVGDDNPPTGDIEFAISNVSANRGQVVCVDVTTNNFTNIQGMGFAFAWDPSVMSFSDVRNITLPGLGESSFATSGNDRLILLYNPTSSQSVADGTVLFQLCFTTTDPCGPNEFSDVRFVPGNVPIEVIDANNAILDPVFTNGRVNVANCNDTMNPFNVTFVEVVQPRCNNTPEGVVRVEFSGQVDPVSCLWVNDGTGNAVTLACDLVGVVGGTYTFTGRDGAGREVIQSITLNNPPPINIDGDISGNGCDGTGQIALTVTGGTAAGGLYTYEWSGGLPNSPTVTGLPAATYRVTVRDDNGCAAVRDFVVAGDDLSTFVDPLVTNNTDENTPNGSIDLRPTDANLTYSWSTGATTSSISDLPGGDYTVRISNAEGCVDDLAFTVVDDFPDQPIDLSGLINDAISRYNGFGVSCNGEADGIIEGTFTGACDEGPVRIFINGIEVTLPAENLPAGMHTLRIEDACGDVAEDTFILEEPDAITLNGDLSVVTCPSSGQNNGVVSFPLIGGTGIYTITPSIGVAEGVNTVSGVGLAPFNIVVQDENGCQVMFQDQEITDPTCTDGGGVIVSDACEGRAIISPNGDTVNDNFLIPCVSGGSNQPNSLAIYDRWGNLVMEADNYDNTWTGTNMDGEPLPEGGYMWVLRTETPGQRDLFRGTVSILR